jgi:hypothetical protein
VRTATEPRQREDPAVLRPSLRLRRFLTLASVTLVVGAAALLMVLGSGTQASAQEERGGPQFNNDLCYGCHDVDSLPVPLPSGETLDATVERETYEGSVHGQLELPCVLCHTNIEGYPHPEITAQTLREFATEHYQSCFGCHQEQYTATQDNVHATARAGGNLEAAVCTDCHGAHDVARPSHSGVEIAQTCRTCHSEIYDLYEGSIHGEALTTGNTDVPTCTDCHGVHDSRGPTDSNFHLFSPQICADCHADEDLMGEYDISTNVFETYVSDFHGTTVVLFEELAPDQETNKPVCVDCHGVHGIVSAEDPESTVFRENLLSTCQRCHPDASANFPTAWLSHYQPSPDEATLVWLVQIFYRIIIPLVIGAMALYVIIDAIKRVRAGKRVERVHHG